MATYLPNSTDIFPQAENAAPNYQLMSQALGALTQRYDVGFNKLKTMYGSLLNSPVTNPEVEAMRQNWFKKNNENLKQYSHVDLAIQSNVSSAMSSFDPLVENKSFVADMGFTRQYQQTASTINQYKNSTDEKTRKLYNPLMEEYVMRGMQGLKKAKFDEIPNHSVRNYLAVEDPQTYLDAQAKANDLKIVRDKSTGMYILKSTNGPDAKQDFTEWADRLLGSGQYAEYYNRAASVTVDRGVDQIMSSTPGVTREQALAQIAQASLPEIYTSHSAYVNSLNYNLVQMEKMKAAAMHEYGNTVPPEVALQLQEVGARYKATKAKLDEAMKKPESVANGADKIVQNFVANPTGYQAQVLRSKDSRNWANTYADVHSEQELRVDTWKVNQYDQAQQNMRQQRGFNHDVRMKGLEHYYRKEEEKYKKQLEADGIITQGVASNQTENITPVEAFEKDITTKVAQAANYETDRDVLSVALNLNEKGGGRIPGGSLAVLEDAIRSGTLNFYRGIALTPQQTKVLNEFTQITTRQDFKSFSQVHDIIRNGLKEHTTHRLREKASKKYSQGLFLFDQANKLATDEQAVMREYAKTYPDAFKMVNGKYVRVGNHAADPVLAGTVPNRQAYENTVGQTLPSLTYSVNAKDNDMSHITRTVTQATSAGYYDQQGKFVPFDAEDVQKLKMALGNMGTQNIRESMDANITLVPGDRYGGKAMVRVTIPLLRKGEKNKIALAGMGIPSSVAKAAEGSNSITFMVPAEKANELGMNRGLIKTANGSIVQSEDIGSYMVGKAQNAAEESPFSSTLLSLNRGSNFVQFPEYMKVRGVNGGFSKSNGMVYITLHDDNGNTISEEPTGVSEINTQTARLLEQSAVTYIDKMNDAEHAKVVNRQQSNRQQAKSNWVPVNSIF